MRYPSELLLENFIRAIGRLFVAVPCPRDHEVCTDPYFHNLPWRDFAQDYKCKLDSGSIFDMVFAKTNPRESEKTDVFSV